MSKKNFLTLALMVVAMCCHAAERMVSFARGDAGFAVVDGGKPASIIVNDGEDEAVKIAAASLSDDFARVCGTKAAVGNGQNVGERTVIVGTVATPYINKLLTTAQAKELKGKWEKYIITTVKTDGKAALLIAGSDRRGAVYGIYELSRQMGVSPWYWWADVPTERRTDVVVKSGTYTVCVATATSLWAKART